MVIHKTSLPANFTPIASPAASLGILSGSQSGSSSFLYPRLSHPSHSYTSFHHSSLSFLLIFFYSRCSLFTPDSSFSLCSRVSSLYQLYSFLSSLFLYLPTFLPPFVASLGILSGSSLSLLLPPSPLFPLVTALSSPSIFPLYSRLPSPLPLSSALPPCQTPLAVCRLCSSAITARCYYEPPTILVPPMLVDAADHLARYCLLALSLLLQV